MNDDRAALAPRTEAGRALLSRYAGHARHGTRGLFTVTPSEILAIEAEARSEGLGLDALRAAAEQVESARDAYRDAINGKGHPGVEHDDVLAPGGHIVGEVVVLDIVGDCTACGGAQYGTEDALSAAHARLRDALGLARRPWEVHHPRALAAQENPEASR